MKLNFSLLTDMIHFCSQAKTQAAIESSMQWKHSKEQTEATFKFAVKQKLLIKAPTQVVNGKKRPDVWEKNISLDHYATKKAA